jgi:hypothetical protein
MQEENRIYRIGRRVHVESRWYWAIGTPKRANDEPYTEKTMQESSLLETVATSQAANISL